MSQGNGAAADADLVLRDRKDVETGENLRRKRFVELHNVDIVYAAVREALIQSAGRRDGAGAENVRIDTGNRAVDEPQAGPPSHFLEPAP